MKALTRTNYKWEEISKVMSGENYITTDGKILTDIDILAVRNGYTKKYVACKNCGELIRNTPEAIEKHCRKKENKANCETCGIACFKSEKKTTQKTVVSNGNYKRIVIEEGYVQCGARYVRTEIAKGEVDISNGRPYGYLSCRHFACRNYGTTEIKPLLVEHFPDFYSVLPTERALIENGWKLKRNFDTSRIYEKGKMTARCDAKGIVEHFTYKFRTSEYDFVYSPKYGFAKQVYSTGRLSLRNEPTEDMSETTVDKLKRELDKLFV